MLDILGKVRLFCLAPHPVAHARKGFSDEKGYIHNGRYELDNHSPGYAPRGLQAD
ncbi:hypothetical protein vB_PsyM_KIL1_0164 [Pseudomonas phage vB_PsyM_KIL1]|uniref:Uncharacterized protein n=1 Tax=Pseudomonas phage vB_PsyM_KIL1 TaxID=1777065 RepID=A0A142IDV6_9CAUD|nr:hypothetical protein BH774_gp038 [Pseudomonas phage vB_PsyM_KIL1]AMR57411.1 hypothetical protein vB_PsyM_KIL1_0164 [Pseudomonas phage vB_PsyM_KIL1]